MSCKNIRYQLPDFIIEKLSPADEATIREHIKYCESCQSEVASLREAINIIQKENIWSPNNNYWVSLLPRIHKRIEERSNGTLPNRLIKYAVPMMAAIAIIIGIVGYLPSYVQRIQLDAQTELTQLPQSELQDFMDQQPSDGMTEDQSLISGTMVSGDDIVILKSLAEEEYYSLVNELDYDSLLEAIGGQDAESIVSILEKKIKPS